MAYSEAVLRRAQARLAQAKADHEAESAARIDNIYTQYPRLREIDHAMRRSVAQAVSAAFRKGSDTTAAINAIKEENLALQREREWILEANDLDESALEPAPFCPHCGGTGYVGAVMCECLRELCRQEQRKELTVLTGAAQESFAAFRLDYYPDRFDPALGASARDIMTLTLSTCKRYAQSFTMKSGNLLLNGNPGLGKTFLSACIARTVSDNGYSVVYETASRLFAQLEKARFSGDAEAHAQSARFAACDLLIIDDLGSELVTPFVQAALYSLVNDRLLGGLPTIVSSNLQSGEFSQRYGPSVASRLLGSYRQVTFVGQDIRLLKNRGPV